MLLLFAAACAGSGETPSPAPAAAPPKREPIAFNLPDFDPAATRRAANRNPRTGNEVDYAAFSGANGFAAVVLVRAGTGFSLEPRDLAAYVQRMLPEAAEITWEDHGRVVGAAPGRSTEYRAFELPERGARCFAFDGRWRPAAAGDYDDRGHRFTRQAFGFYCRTAGRPLGEADIRQLIGAMSFAGDDA